MYTYSVQWENLVGFLIWQFGGPGKKKCHKPHNPSHSSRCSVPVPKKIPVDSQRKEIHVANESMRHALGEASCGSTFSNAVSIWRIGRYAADRLRLLRRHFPQFASYWNQSWSLCHRVIEVTSIFWPRKQDPQFKICLIKEYNVFIEITEFNTHQTCYTVLSINFGGA